MYAIVLLNASLIGAGALAVATSYAVGDTFGVRHSLHWGFSQARGFYLSFMGLVLGAAAIVLIPGAPLGLITEAVQALAGVLLPSASLFLLLLCNDRQVLGPWVNRAWVNVIAAIIISALLELSAILTVTTLFPEVDLTRLVEVLTGVLGTGLAALGAGFVLRRPQRVQPEVIRQRRQQWSMPPLALLEPPPQTLIRRVALGAMWVYLVAAILLLCVKVIQLAAVR
jgi:hypothetical protein